jgi:hypothetical protein
MAVDIRPPDPAVERYQLGGGEHSQERLSREAESRAPVEDERHDAEVEDGEPHGSRRDEAFVWGAECHIEESPQRDERVGWVEGPIEG